MTLSMRHATWQQLSHESRAAINAIVANVVIVDIVDIRRMHLIAKIKTYTQHNKNNNKQYMSATTTKSKEMKRNEKRKYEKPQKRRQ